MTQEHPTIDDSASGNGGGQAQQEGGSQLGQALRDLGRVTRRLPNGESTATRQTRFDSALRERIAGQIAALGDPAHPQHSGAVDELTRIGDPAVPALINTLGHAPSWLLAYRAAEALGQIGDGRATSALLQALGHPNSNVRWSAVRALAQIGDARALFALRRVARDDRGKTSWGESVSAAAQGALDQMQASSMLLRGVDLVKTALACVLMIVALIVCFSTVGELREAWREFGEQASSTVAAQPRIRPTAVPRTPEPTAASEPTAAPEVAAAPVGDVAATGEITGTAQLTANVREGPSQSATGIGQVVAGETLLVTGVSADGQWYRVRLGDSPAEGSRIDGEEGWVYSALISRLEQQPEVVTE
jgi:hypothetical protein